MQKILENCCLCPRKCNINRKNGIKFSERIRIINKVLDHFSNTRTKEPQDYLDELNIPINNKLTKENIKEIDETFLKHDLARI